MYLKWTEIFSAMLFPWGGFFLMFQHGEVTRGREEEKREERGEEREERGEGREEEEKREWWKRTLKVLHTKPLN
jgi:hypothetical protein